MRLTTTKLLISLAILATAAVLAGCGSSSPKSSTSASAQSPSAQQAPAGQPGQGQGRFMKVEACLRAQGINMPARPQGASRTGTYQPGQHRSFTLPAGVTRAKLQAAMAKCGGGFGAGFRAGAGFDRQGLTRFTACMRQHGVNLPAPNTTGHGSVFSSKGVNMQSAAFKSAEKACASTLRPSGASTGGYSGAGAPAPAPSAPAAQ